MVDDEAEMRARYAQEERDFAQAEALVGVLEGGRGAELFDKAVEGGNKCRARRIIRTRRGSGGKSAETSPTPHPRPTRPRSEAEASSAC